MRLGRKEGYDLDESTTTDTVITLLWPSIKPYTLVHIQDRNLNEQGEGNMQPLGTVFSLVLFCVFVCVC